MNKIGFPGFGIEGFELKNTVSIFGTEILISGILLAVAIIFGFIVFYRKAVKKELIDADHIYNVTLITLPVSIIFARAVYILFNLDAYKGKAFLNVIAGNLSFYGALVFGLIAVLIYCKAKKIKALSMLDAIAPALFLGQMIGCFGRFFGESGYGWTANVEKLPWRMELENAYIDGIAGGNLVHPSFIYDFLASLIGLIAVLVILRKKKFDGSGFFFYLGFYGIFRIFIELIAADSRNSIYKIILCVIAVIAAVIGAITSKKKAKAEAEETEEYKSAFSAAVLAAVKDEKDALDESVFEAENAVEENEEAAEEIGENEQNEPETEEEK